MLPSLSFKPCLRCSNRSFTVLLVLAIATALVRALGAEHDAPIHWAPTLPYFDRPNARILMQGSLGWAGFMTDDDPRADLFWIFQDGRWQPAPPLPEAEQRSQVFDIAPGGELWACPFSSDRVENDDPLTVARFDGEWHLQVVRPGLWPQVIRLVTDEEAWIGGNHGALLHFQAGRWRKLYVDGTPRDLEHRNVMGIEMIDPADGWLVGTRGLVARYRDGVWRRECPPIADQMSFRNLTLGPDGRLWIIDQSGSLICNDGLNWSQVPLPGRITDMAITASGEHWLVGGNSIFRGDGSRWRRQPVPIADNLHGIVMLAEDEGWVVGRLSLLHGTTAAPPLLMAKGVPNQFLPTIRAPSLCLVADFDGDRRLDIIVCDEQVPKLFLNRQEAGFSIGHGLAPVAELAITTGLMDLAAADLDQDGDVDLFAVSSTPGRCQVFLNQGDGRFAAGSDSPQLEDMERYPSIHLLDMNDDGRVDLYAASDQGSTHSRGQAYFFNHGLGRFSAEPSGRVPFLDGKTALWGDFDGDADMDLILVAYEGSQSQLFRNDGRGGFKDATTGSGLAAIPGTMITEDALVWDLEPDGDLDLILLRDRIYILLNRGDGHFPTLRASDFEHPLKTGFLAMADLDQDGRPELLTNSLRDHRVKAIVFTPNADGSLRERSEDRGLSQISCHGLIPLDWDGDGDLDLLATVAHKNEMLYFSNGSDNDHYLAIQPRGVLSNRDGIGARVLIYPAGYLDAAEALLGHAQMGTGRAAFRSLGPLHFGLAGTSPCDLRVIFPGGHTVALRGVPAGRLVTVWEYPWGIRHFLFAFRALRDAVRTLDPLGESLGLLLAAALLAGARSLSLRRHGVHSLFRDPRLIVLLLLAHLAAVPILVLHDAHGGFSLAGLALALGSIMALDLLIERRGRAAFFGHYKLKTSLGEGGMGQVMLARDVISGRQVALKLLHAKWVGGAAARLRFLEEGDILTRLAHPGIVRVYETGEINGRGYISMEYLAGHTLTSEIAGARLDPARALPIMDAVCQALRYIHEQGILHHDIKSDNIFLLDGSQDPGSGPAPAAGVKLMDFGLAQALGSRSGRPLRLKGTLPYMSAAQLRGEPARFRDDLHALGVVLYECLAGRRPFEGGDGPSTIACILAGHYPPLETSVPRIEPALAALVDLALEQGEQELSLAAWHEDLRALLAAFHADPDRVTSPRPSEPDIRAQEALGPPEEAAWQTHYLAARQLFADGRRAEAKHRLIHSLAELQTILDALSPAEREAYLARDLSRQALAFFEEKL